MIHADINRAGWGADWIACGWCWGDSDDPNCPMCDGKGGWPASATRFDDEPVEESFHIIAEAAE